MDEREFRTLKRFQYLEIDGLPRRERPPKREPEPAPPPPQRGSPSVGVSRRPAPLSETRAYNPAARPVAPRPEPPRQYNPAARAVAPTPEPPRRYNSAARPVPPAEAPRAMRRPGASRPSAVGDGAVTTVREREFVLDLMREVPVERAPWDSPGVYVEEVDLSERFARSQPRDTARQPPRRDYAPAPARRAEPAPIELTELAARQIRILAYQHGVMGAGLRILTSVGGECDFAFEMEPEPDDVVFLSQGIRVIIDAQSLRGLRGRRITYQDVPGAEGFRIG